jgi:UDP-N-acetylmuramyl tripeptide synthase
VSIFTAEDPRTESLEEILQDMAEAALEAGGVEGENFWRVPDRGGAIRQAVALAQSGDLVLVCGKGHEQSMCFEKTELAWDDRTALRAALAEHLGIAGPGMPWLPTSKS